MLKDLGNRRNKKEKGDCSKIMTVPNSDLSALCHFFESLGGNWISAYTPFTRVYNFDNNPGEVAEKKGHPSNLEPAHRNEKKYALQSNPAVG